MTDVFRREKCTYSSQQQKTETSIRLKIQDTQGKFTDQTEGLEYAKCAIIIFSAFVNTKLMQKGY